MDRPKANNKFTVVVAVNKQMHSLVESSMDWHHEGVESLNEFDKRHTNFKENHFIFTSEMRTTSLYIQRPFHLICWTWFFVS